MTSLLASYIVGGDFFLKVLVTRYTCSAFRVDILWAYDIDWDLAIKVVASQRQNRSCVLASHVSDSDSY